MRTIFHWMICTFLFVVSVGSTMAQKVDEERMNRDIAVAENVLTTLIKQQFDNQRMFFPLEVRGSYQSGYGVTFTLDRKSTRLNSSHVKISYAVFCLKKKKTITT